MSENVTALLKSFTPTSLDRDALLFAAGRASARPSLFWKAACGLLVTTQLVTLSLWFVRPNLPVAAPTALPQTETIDPPSVVPFEPYSYLALARQGEFELAARPSELPPVPPTKPLTAGAWRDMPQ